MKPLNQNIPTVNIDIDNSTYIITKWNKNIAKHGISLHINLPPGTEIKSNITQSGGTISFKKNRI